MIRLLLIFPYRSYRLPFVAVLATKEEKLKLQFLTPCRRKVGTVGKVLVTGTQKVPSTVPVFSLSVFLEDFCDFQVHTISSRVGSVRYLDSCFDANSDSQILV